MRLRRTRCTALRSNGCPDFGYRRLTALAFAAASLSERVPVAYQVNSCVTRASIEARRFWRSLTVGRTTGIEKRASSAKLDLPALARLDRLRDQSTPTCGATTSLATEKREPNLATMYPDRARRRRQPPGRAVGVFDKLAVHGRFVDIIEHHTRPAFFIRGDCYQSPSNNKGMRIDQRRACCLRK